MQKFFISAIFSLAICLTLPLAVSAADCGYDPVNERDDWGKTLVGSRVRDAACIEDTAILTVLPAGTRIHIIAETDGWYQVEVGDKTGWIARQLVYVYDEDDDSVKKIPTSATKIIGINEKDFKRLQEGNLKLRNRLRHMIVLRVERRGQAYLVNEDSDLNYLSAEQVAAYREDRPKLKKEPKKEKAKVRRMIGIGEADFARLEAGDQALRERLRNMLVLRVHAHGRVFWVNPDGGLQYLGPGEIGKYMSQYLRPDENDDDEANDDVGNDDDANDDSIDVANDDSDLE